MKGRQTIYRLTFADGAQYVGRTGRDVRTRCLQHWQNPRMAIGRRLQGGAVPSVIETVSVAGGIARDVEQAAIASIPEDARLNARNEVAEGPRRKRRLGPKGEAALHAFAPVPAESVLPDAASIDALCRWREIVAWAREWRRGAQNPRLHADALHYRITGGWPVLHYDDTQPADATGRETASAIEAAYADARFACRPAGDRELWLDVVRYAHLALPWSRPGPRSGLHRRGQKVALALYMDIRRLRGEREQWPSEHTESGYARDTPWDGSPPCWDTLAESEAVYAAWAETRNREAAG